MRKFSELVPGTALGPLHLAVTKAANERYWRAAGVDGVAGEHDSDEAHLDLAVREEFVAPRVEQRAVGGSGRLHALRDEPGQLKVCRHRRIGVIVAAPRVRAYELLADRQRARDLSRHGAPPSVAAGVNDTAEVHTGSWGASAVTTVASTST